MWCRKVAVMMVCCWCAVAGGATGVQPSGTAGVLDARQKSIVPIAAFAANGQTGKLRGALADGLDAGLTVSEVKEVLIQMYAYTGFPRSLTALETFRTLVGEREAQGIRDEAGREPTPLPPGTDIRQYGTAIQTKLVGRPVTGPVYAFAPAIDTFLKEHLFGDIFARDVLDFRQRELATVSALAALPAEAQLRSHLKVCLNAGLTAPQLREFVSVLKERVGPAEAELAGRLLETLLRENRQDGIDEGGK